MKRVTKKSLMLLLKGVLVIALFSVIVFKMYSVEAEEKKYASFDWDSFKTQNEEKWRNYCDNAYNEQSKNEKENCFNELSTTLESFYKKLYKLLSKYQEKNLYIEDQVILWTIFYGQFYSPTTSNSPYLNSYIKDNRDAYKQWPSGYYGFHLDNSDGSDEQVEPKYSADPGIADFYATEKDSLKMLIRNAVAYYTKCYGVTGDPITTTLSDGSTYMTCEDTDSIVVDDVPHQGTKCVRVLPPGGEMGFWKFFVSRMAHDETLGFFIHVLFLGFASEDEYYDQCMAYKETGEYDSVHYIYEDDPHVSYEMYFDFLKENAFFDGKSNLQFYFRHVLDKAQVDCLKSDTCEDSLEAKGDEEYLKYQEDLEEARLEIIYDILSILDSLGLGIQYGNFTPESKLVPGSPYEDRTAYYWPIGSDTTEVRDGVTYADGEPASKTITSYYGNRVNEVTKKKEFHYGIDIKGVEGSTNVIAVEKGEVVAVYDSCTKGDYECNGGYGNMVILSHSDGNYTVYALLSSIDSSVSVGSTVQKGQVIGKVGQTGRTKDPALHFEIRKNGNSTESAVDPLTIISSEKSRPSGFVGGDFSMHKTSLTREEFISGLVSYCNKNKCSAKTLGYFAQNAGLIYDVSVQNGMNPEFAVVRAISEGFSPNQQDSSYNNYWGVGCANGQGIGACKKYKDLKDGLEHLAQLGIVRKYESALELFTIGHYGYIGEYWFNPGSWSDGGCKYFPSIKQYYSNQGRVSQVNSACSAGPCSGSACLKTNDEDQEAYGLYNISGMSKSRYNIWGL